MKRFRTPNRWQKTISYLLVVLLIGPWPLLTAHAAYVDETAIRLPVNSDDSYSFAVGDVNGDGSPDLFFANKNRQDRLHINNRLGVFTDTTATALPAGQTPGNGAVIADLDGDGDNDIATADGDTGLQVLFNDNGIDERFVPAGLPNPIPTLDAYGVKIAAGDVDFDGSLDLVLGAMGPDKVLMNDGAGVFTDGSAAQLPGVGERTFGLGLSDNDDDLDLDLLFATPQGQNRYLNNVITTPRILTTVTPDHIVEGRVVIAGSLPPNSSAVS